MRRAALAVLALVACASALHASNRYDPRLRFRTISTPRFDIYFHQGEERLARRLAAIAEEVASKMDARLGRPSGRTRIILVDQTDVSNGWATPVPYNLIEITAVPPVPESIIGNTDDWLRLVFTHEYTHVVHLDRSRGLFGGLRRVFGRHALLYPNVYLPPWQIEGIATFEETALTGAGRLAAGDFRMMLDRAAATGRFAGLDRASGSSPDWPGGNAAYLYGAYFHRFLAEKYGTESLARLKEETAGRVPYLGAGAFRTVYGRPLGQLWDEFEAGVGARADRVDDRRTRLTRHGFTVLTPRYDASGRLFYSVANPHGFPALLEWQGDEAREIAPRYFGGGLAPAAGWLVFDQLEVAAHVALQSDLFAVRAEGGGTRRLTRGARAADPDVSPDGQTIVCTIQRTGSRGLATLRFADGTAGAPVDLLFEEDVEYSSPRWSPDGRYIAAERRRLGAPSEIVLVDPAARTVRPLVASPEGRHADPVWSPDGRTVLFASARDGEPFTLFRIDVETRDVQQLAGAGPGAQSPAFSPDGRTLVFVGYSADGYDVYSLPFDTAEWVRAETPTSASAPVAEPKARAEDGAQAATAGPADAYRPWPTLAPTFWTPIVASDDDELVLGAAAGSIDALGRHAYGIGAAWSGSRSRPDWTAAYAYDRWWPTFFVSVSDDTDTFRDGELRTTELDAGALFPFRRVRWNQSVLAAFHAATDTLDCGACTPAASGTAARRALRGGWRLDAARSFGYSISDEEGGSVTLATELTRAAFGADGNAGSVTIDARGFLRAWPRHGVIAGRVAGASAWGDEPVRRVFGAGGPGPTGSGFAFGVDAIGLLRGFDDTDLVGRRAAVVNVDYRLPLVSVQRGAGTWPIFVRTIHAAVFADAGHAWDAGFRVADVRRAFGAELSVDAVLGYALPLTFTAGASWRDDPAAARRDAAFFARVGRAF